MDGLRHDIRRHLRRLPVWRHTSVRDTRCALRRAGGGASMVGGPLLVACFDLLAEHGPQGGKEGTRPGRDKAGSGITVLLAQCPREQQPLPRPCHRDVQKPQPFVLGLASSQRPDVCIRRIRRAATGAKRGHEETRSLRTDASVPQEQPVRFLTGNPLETRKRDNVEFQALRPVDGHELETAVGSGIGWREQPARVFFEESGIIEIPTLLVRFQQVEKDASSIEIRGIEQGRHAEGNPASLHHPAHPRTSERRRCPHERGQHARQAMASSGRQAG